MYEPLHFFFRVFGSATMVVFLVLAVGIYLLPTIVATVRRKRNLPMLAVVNVFLGWTGVAWVAMIVDSFKNNDDP
jgi:hypothetical protein